MKIALASFGQETNSFSQKKTNIDTFIMYGLHKKEEVIEKKGKTSVISGFLKKLESYSDKYRVIPIFRAWAGASGIIEKDTFNYFKEELQNNLAELTDLDAFFFDLHGAAQSEIYHDTEGELLELARKIVGSRTIILIALDHHANVTRKMITNIDAVVAHNDQPHKTFDTGYRAGKLLLHLLEDKGIKPKISLKKIPIITHQEQFLTDNGPMKEWFDYARSFEKLPGVLSTSTYPMQPWLDIPEGGWSAIAVTDNNQELADRIANKLADKAWKLRFDFLKTESLEPEKAIDYALKERGTVILSDTGDSVFGGAGGDNTQILQEMLRQNVREIAFIPIVDAEAVVAAREAGEGQIITIKLGGKLDPEFSTPVSVTAKVIKLGGGILKADILGLESFDVGEAAHLLVNNIHVVVTEKTGVSGNHPILYQHFGLNPATAKLIVVKTASNWQFYEDICSKVIRVNTMGSTMSQLENFKWNNLPRPIFPFDQISH
ncbi:MAG: M81 family metallopeptidase [SAR324 cluster bacterium]|nr:M81 family metallopeptidase [SAR324 cluster bacterium]